MTRTNERGSVVGFVVVGALLAALLIGGIYVVKNDLSGLTGAAEQVATTTEDTVEEVTEDNPEQQDSSEGSTEDGSTTSEEQAAEEAAKENAEQEEAAKEQAAKDQQAAEKKASEQQKAQEKEAAKEQEAAEAEKSAQPEETAETNDGTGSATDDSDDGEALPATGSDAPEPTVDELPKTGVNDVMVSAVAMSAVIGSVVAYRRSSHL